MSTTIVSPRTASEFVSPMLDEWTARCNAAVERYAAGTELRHIRNGYTAKVTAISTSLIDLEPVFEVEYTVAHLKGLATSYHLCEIGDHFAPASSFVGLPTAGRRTARR